MIRKYVGTFFEKLSTAVATRLAQHNITPNMLTVTGLIINGIAGLTYYNGAMVAGGYIILFAGIFDMLDGALARVTNTVSKIGAFTDAVVDRYSDFFIFGGLCAYYASNGEVGKAILVLTIIVGSFLVSYIRARAELVILKCDVGLMERPERIILLAAGSILGFLTLALWILAIGTHLTAIYRIKYTFKQSKK